MVVQCMMWSININEFLLLNFFYFRHTKKHFRFDYTLKSQITISKKKMNERRNSEWTLDWQMIVMGILLLLFFIFVFYRKWKKDGTIKERSQSQIIYVLKREWVNELVYLYLLFCYTSYHRVYAYRWSWNNNNNIIKIKPPQPFFFLFDLDENNNYWTGLDWLGQFYFLFVLFLLFRLLRQNGILWNCSHFNSQLSS